MGSKIKLNTVKWFYVVVQNNDENPFRNIKVTETTTINVTLNNLTQMQQLSFQLFIH